MSATTVDIDTLYILDQKPFWEWHLGLLYDFDEKIKKYVISEEDYIEKYGKKGVHRVKYAVEATAFLVKLYNFYGNAPLPVLPSGIQEAFTAAWKYFFVCLYSPEKFLDVGEARKDLDIEYLKANYG